ncbi:DNA repair protein RAD50 [Monoraphidium neglectum]|uniref:DNA repair protein RAD50 n=1 Tax=Monoraphidium neglectum TaxID=145388 RepID=A0A0D2K2Z6_9CHLO|nr:DNA repair protein RAD50 [Monoraphidium neglectum]KIZ04903.1 DNA repair protein RAD50 [Monoraphidium neglectum]|eukprot:XP_013903922.1 DNA repair protein RAD50 [Monoraphidium neglectum]
MAAAELDASSRLVGDLGWQAAALDRAVADLEKQVSEMERRAASSAASGRSVSDVDEDLSALENQRHHKEYDRDQLLKKQGRARDEVLAMSLALGDLRQRVAELREAAKRRADLQRRLEDIGQQQARPHSRQRHALPPISAQADAAAAIDAAGRDLAPLGASRDAAVEQRAAARAAAAQREGALDSQIREAVAARDQVAARCRPVDEYLSAGRSADLARTSGELDALNRRIEDAHKHTSELEAALQEKQGSIAEMSDTRRDIHAVLDSRRTEAKQRELEASLARLQEQKQQAHRTFEDKRRQRDDLRSSQDRVKGRLEVERQTMRQAEVELSQPMYNNIDLKTKMMMVEVSTTKLACDDLDKYHRALEKALLTFHTTKMADINRTVKELWQKTYRGQDIDYIQIKADADGARSYNYRVVMYSGGVELDMRGRCSAGQKVLASLIIRLALAETFCLNCGILALDEPTTNLDAANASALAEALRTVMATRRDQENFQLIVITHDETFASLIGTRQHAEFLWRVTKDEAQHSHVAQEDINE